MIRVPNHSPGRSNPVLRAGARWWIFCRVVDNFGDAGICWRLARQLAGEWPNNVRLVIDQLSVLRYLDSNVRTDLDTQYCAGVEICHWNENPAAAFASQGDFIPDVIVEAFGCGLPPTVGQLYETLQGHCAPVWINLEYFSAENWVPDFHGLPSPQPGGCAVRHFYIPGVDAASGGVLRERDLFRQRDAFQADDSAGRAARASFWARVGIDPPAANELTISMFSYPHAPLADWLDVLAAAPERSRVLVTGGLFEEVLSTWGIDAAQTSARRGALCVQRIPFLSQVEYDLLLWASDINFVRGEDSLVRAVWAARPCVWHIYRQEGGSHKAKLAAFVDQYLALGGATSDGATALRNFWMLWNGIDGTTDQSLGRAWQDWCNHQPSLRASATRYAQRLGDRTDLASGLVAFAARLAS